MISRWQQFFNLKLRSKLIISYIILTVIPVSVIGYIAYKQYVRSIEQQVGEYIPLLLEQASEDIENEMNSLKKMPDLLYNSNQVIEVLRKDAHQNKSSLLKDQFTVNSYLARTFINGGNPDILGAFIVSKNRLFSSTKIPYEQFDFSNPSLPYGQDLNLKGKTAILLPSDVSLVFENHPNYVLLMKQLMDVENRTVLGTIFIAVDTDFIKHAVENLEQKNKSDMWLMTADGHILYDTNPKLVGSVDAAAAKYPRINGSFRSPAEDKLISTHTLAGLSWTLVHSVKVEHLTENTNQLRNVLVILFLLFVCISTLLCVIMAWNVSDPLSRLTRLMKRVEKGEFDVDFSVASKDEIGILAHGFNSMIARIKQLIQENYQIALQQKEAQLYALQSQINPHFIYNTLETISMAVETGQDRVVVKMVTLLGRMLRYSIGNKSSFVPIAQELKHTQDYLTIQKIRFEDRLSFQVAAELDVTKYIVPKFILQPVVENSVKYGLEQEEDVHIEIRVYEEDGGIVFHIQDNGPGMEEAVLQRLQEELEREQQVKRDGSFGLMNVHTRVRMTFGAPYGMRVTSGGQGTTVLITVPAQREEEQYAS
ncbi:cache domain-containing sensor histidine kinase [Ectobacillus ponti]|uniref:Sensor histidine kinase n=1 Tax=Ectobacillus ponti TaxID=2961894 RepID=A0AA42BPR6_9BACI|nr:sensor histidine kinase [Ectobacillus ponti]MCP8967764.1 sensor histidine kinase [Ectobacillus ponti]